MLAVPNFSEGRDQSVVSAIAAALSATTGVELLDIHSDPDHNRSVYTLTGAPMALVEAVVRGAVIAVGRIDLTRHQGAHPHVGALDVAPVVHLDPGERGAACAAALVLADRLGQELGLPVFLYGELTGNRVARAQLRQGGTIGLRDRIDRAELTPDFGPPAIDPVSGAVLVAARPPLIAFNVELASPADLQAARSIAALIREGGAEGLPGVRAIGLTLPTRGGIAQVSMNIEDYRRTPLSAVVTAIARHATPTGAELIGLAPLAAFDGFPAELPVAGRRHIEDLLH